VSDMNRICEIVMVVARRKYVHRKRQTELEKPFTRIRMMKEGVWKRVNPLRSPVGNST
jgi:hypothetical protein